LSEIEFEIDGKLVTANQGDSIISIADREGIDVPRFCYHKKLSVAANCRMCLVDVEGVPKAQPACSTPVANGMKIHTRNDKAKSAQKAVMEFLLINHPLDCPICDQGGECELQDVAMEYGTDVSKFNLGKRIVADKGIGALIQTDMTRCIHCTRCVRFGAEVAGIVEMGGTGRGEGVKIEPFLTEGIQSELSGNMIDVCPVGALTSKPFRYEARTWQMNAVETIARHDLVGSNIYTQTYRGRVKRVVARDNELVNETWISDRDRFSYEGLNHESRALHPKIKKNNKWQETSWEVALDFAISGLKKNTQNADQLGVLASKNSTLEEYYLMQKLARGFGSENIDYRLDKADLSIGNTMLSNITLAEMESTDHALIVNSYLRLEQPMINHRIRKATLNGASVNTINNKKFDFNYQTDLEILSSPQKTLLMLQSILKSLHERTKTTVPKYLSKLTVDDSQNKIADDLIAAERPVIILGEHVNSNISSSDIASIISEIAALANAKIANLSLNGNSLSAEKVGFKPSNNGKNAISMFTENTKAFLLMDVDFNYDFIDSKLAADTFNNDDVFVISLNSFEDEITLMNSDVILPLAGFYESSGTHINFDGVAQSFSASVKGPGDSKPGWKIIKVLADILELNGFEYTDSTQVADDALSMSSANNNDLVKNNIKETDDSKVAVHWQYSPYAIDGITRKAKALQETPIGKMNDAFISLATAKELKLSEGDLYHGVPVSINETVAEGCVFVHTYQSRKG
jgi:NADH-quinone oxidoreductase subunit G